MENNIDESLTVKQPFLKSLGNVLGNAFPVVGSLINGFFNYKAQKQSNIRNLQTAKELENYRYNRDLLQYQKALEYNTPKNQMERFKEAGLNPNLIYSRGSSGEAPAVMPKYGQIQSDQSLPSPVNLPTIGQFYDKRLMYQNLQQAEAQTRIKDAEAFMKTQQASAMTYYIFEEAYARAKEAGYKGSKAEFDKSIMNEFSSEYGSFMENKWKSGKPMLEKYSAEAEKAGIDAKQAQLMHEYTKKGLPWMIPLNLIFGNLLRLK